MEKLDFSKAAETSVKQSGTSVRKLRPGIHEHVIINRVQAISPEGKNAEGQEKSPYVEIQFVEPSTNAELVTKFYTSTSALPFTIARIKDLLIAAGKVVPEEASIESIAQMLTGQAVSLRVYGEEVLLGDGKVVIVSKLSPQPFCAPPGKTSKLYWNEQKAIKRIAVNETKKDDATDDMPF